MMKYLIGILMAGLLLVSVGCGRHKGEVPTSLGRNQSNRIMAVGDKVVYDLDVTFQRPDGSTVGTPQTGIITVEVKKGHEHKNVASIIKHHFDVSETMEVGANASGEIDWLGQDEDGAVYFLGRLAEGTDWALVTDSPPHVDLPAVLTDKSSWAYTMHLTNGTENSTGKVLKIQKVSTPAGEFETFKTRTTGLTAQGNSYKGYTWFRPEFPLGVKVEQLITNKHNPKLTTHIVQTLKSYHFAE